MLVQQVMKNCGMKFKKILFIFLFCFSFLLGGCINNPDDDSTDDSGDVQQKINKKVAYIPLDDRPVNIDRVQYLVESLDYDIVMPDSDLYKTHLDNQPLNSNNTQYGDMQKLIEWLEQVEADFYVISLDQLLSGGLVNSRVMTEDDYSQSFELIDRLLNVIGDKETIVFDTVMRLASTVGYLGYESNVYNDLRAYANKARKILQDEKLTIQNIVQGYKYDSNNSLIMTRLSNEVVEKYLKARERKLNLSLYYLDKVKEKDNIYTYYGVDDSSPNLTIQTNEINLIKKNIVNGTIFAGCDELALMSITKLCINNYQADISVKVTYVGGMENSSADNYDIGTLKDNVEAHLNSLGVKISDNGEVEVLVLTKAAANNATEKTKNADAMLTLINYNIQNMIPTIVIDVSSNITNNHKEYFQPRLLNEVSLGQLLSYSSWNTAGNAIGIALSNGLSRYSYLKYDQDKTTKALEGFIKTLVFSYVKDISYRVGGQSLIKSYISEEVGPISNFYAQMIEKGLDEQTVNKKFTNKMNSIFYECNLIQLMSNLNNSCFLVDLSTNQMDNSYKISCTDFYFPWYRTFEISFSIRLEK